jgi:hypothetical protein
VPIPPDFITECLYAPEAWFIHDVDFYPDEKRLVGHLDTRGLETLVSAQREWPLHEKHLPGGIALQITAILAQLYGIYVLDMRATEGWVGFGTHVQDAKFPTMGRIGPPVECHLREISHRPIRSTWFTQFEFEYTQNDNTIYQSRQTAAWMRSEHRGPLLDEHQQGEAR